MSNLFHDFFKLVLITFSDLGKDYIYKCFKNFVAITKKDLEFFLYNKYNEVAFNLLLMFLLVV